MLSTEKENVYDYVFFYNTFFFTKKIEKNFKLLRSGWNFPESCVSVRAFERYLIRGSSSNRLKVMAILLPKNKTYFQKTKRIEIRFVFWLSERSKLAITFKRFELEPRIRYHSKALTETHLSGKFQPDRSSLKIFGFYEKKNVL